MSSTKQIRRTDASEEVFRSLREAILSGELTPGSALNQVRLAERFGTSRGPLREAIRRLQTEGLIEAAYNQRARVMPITIEEVEQVYSARIVLESLCLEVSAPLLTTDEFTALRAQLLQMNNALEVNDVRLWNQVHDDFHRLLLSHAGIRVLRDVEMLREHSIRHRRFAQNNYDGFGQARNDHSHLVDLCESGDISQARILLVRHLSRTALSVIALLDELHEPAAVRTAVRLSTSQTSLDNEIPQRKALEDPAA